MLFICAMNILLVSATTAEIALTIQYLDSQWANTGITYEYDNIKVDMLTAGVGIMATAYSLGELLAQKQYDFALQCGIGGSFDRSIPLGTVLSISSEQMGDMGAEDQENYLDIYELGLSKENDFPFLSKKLLANAGQYAPLIDLPVAESITVNTVTGKQATINKLKDKYNCQIESMEGAAFHYACLKRNIPFAQIRAISNYVEPRNRKNWQIGLAVTNLNNWLVMFLQNIKKNNF